MRIFLLSIFSLLILSFVFSRSSEQIAQELQVEQAIHTKVEAVLTRLLHPSEHVIIVNATMSEKSLSLSSDTSSEDNNTSSSLIPGMPTIPQNISSPTDNGVINYSTDKFLLYHLEIAIYLDESKATGKMTQNITLLIKEAIPDIVDCDDCIRFETITLGEYNKTSDYNDLLERIEELEEERRIAEEQIAIWKFIHLQTQPLTSEDSIRLAKYIKIENDYRRKQDSLILVTSNKLDAAIRKRIESESNSKQELIDLIKDEIYTDVAFPDREEDSIEQLNCNNLESELIEMFKLKLNKMNLNYIKGSGEMLYIGNCKYQIIGKASEKYNNQFVEIDWTFIYIDGLWKQIKEK